MNKKSVKFLLCMALVCFAHLVVEAQQKKAHPKKPNIIMVISDDTGWGESKGIQLPSELDGKQ